MLPHRLAYFADGSSSNWCERGRWTWYHPRLRREGCTQALQGFDLSRRNTSLEAVTHAARHAWRRERFLEWLNGNRHEAQSMIAQHGVLPILRGFHRQSLDKIRQHMQLGPAQRSVLLGSVVSDSWLFEAGRRESAECCLCGHERGSFEHLAWECRVTRQTRCPRPVCPLEARLGWGNGATTLTHLASCVQLLWEDRYPRRR